MLLIQQTSKYNHCSQTSVSNRPKEMYKITSWQDHIMTSEMYKIDLIGFDWFDLIWKRGKRTSKTNSTYWETPKTPFLRTTQNLLNHLSKSQKHLNFIIIIFGNSQKHLNFFNIFFGNSQKHLFFIFIFFWEFPKTLIFHFFFICHFLGFPKKNLKSFWELKKAHPCNMVRMSERNACFAAPITCASSYTVTDRVTNQKRIWIVQSISNSNFNRIFRSAI